VGRVPVLLFLTVAKGLLVILYYMHLKFDNRIYSFFFGAGVLAFAVPFVISLIFLMAPPTLESARGENGGENGGEARPTPNPNAGPPITFVTEGGEFFFRPDTVTPNAGQVVRVTLNNTGSVEHTFVIASQPRAQLPEPWVTNDGRLVARAAPGATGRGSFTSPAPGEWVFYCNVPGHAVAGMHGIVNVQ
jgi:plastocyanin